MLYSGVQYAILFVLSIVLARTLGEEGLGLYSYLTALTIPLWIAIEFGLDNYFVRELARSPQKSHELAVKGISFRLIFAVLMLVFIVPVIVVSQEGSVTKIGFVLLSIAFLPHSVYAGYCSVLRSQQRYYHAMRFDMFGALIIAAGAIIVLFLFHSILAVIAIATAVDFLKLFAILPLYKKEFGVSLLKSLDFHISRHRDLLKAALPFALLNVVVALHLRMDVLLLEHFRSAAEVGIFTAAERFINVAMVVPLAMYNGLLPLFSLSRGKSFAVRFSIQTLLVFSGIGLLITLFFYFAASMIIHLTFRFPESVAVLQILAWSFLFLTFNLIAESWLYGHQMERRALYARCVGLAVLIIANIYFVPRFGAQGTALSTTLTEICLSGIFIVVLLRVNYKKSVVVSQG